MPSVRRTYQGQKTRLDVRLGMTVPQATPKIPRLPRTSSMLNARLQIPSASNTGTRGLCLLMPSREPEVTEVAGQNKSVIDNIMSTVPEVCAYCAPIQSPMNELPRNMKVIAMGSMIIVPARLLKSTTR